MAEHFSFFDPMLDTNGLPDRDYNAQEFTDYFNALVTTGLMKGAGKELAVATSGSNMVTMIDKGIAFVEGKQYINTDLLAHTHDTESLGKNRIDRIVIRMDLNTDARHVKSFVKKGVASASPVAPVLTQTPNVYEISLAQVKVIGGQTFINKVDVVDERGIDVVCPWAGSNIFPNFDDAALEELVNKVENMYTLTDGPKLHVYNGDLNDLNDAGFYTISTSTPNRPNPHPGLPVDYAILVMPFSATSTAQVGIPTSRTDTNIMRRIKIGTSWGPWFPAVVLNDTLTSTSTTEAATANAVKQLNDKLISNEVIIGTNAGADNAGISIGMNALARSSGVALGRDSFALGQYHSVALGGYANATADISVAVGYSAKSLNIRQGVLGTGGTIDGANKWLVPGSFSVAGTKQFEIPHPHPNKINTHVIRHGAVESPTTGDTLYRYFVDVKGDIAEVRMVGSNDIMMLPTNRSEVSVSVSIPLPDYWVYLNKDDQVFVSPDRHFSNGYGFVDRVNESLELTFKETRKYNVAVFGTRNDSHESIQTWDIKGVEREIGESWIGETYSFEVSELTEITEFGEEF